MQLLHTLHAWNSPGFENALKHEVESLEPGLLPLQQGLSHSSHVGCGKIRLILLDSEESADFIRVKAGIFYTGVIAGACCSDDPSPMNEQTEYSELCFDIDKQSAETRITVL